MDDLPEEEITFLLRAWGNGQDGALESLLPLIHGHLRALARRFMVRERPGHTLQTTALMNEAYLRLMRTRDIPWCNRVHFFAISAPNYAVYSGGLGTLKTRSEAPRSRMPIRIG